MSTQGSASKEQDMIIERIKKATPPGTIISKPKAKSPFYVKGNGMRRGENALIYFIPNHTARNKPYEKGVTISEIRAAYSQLVRTGKLTRSWLCEYFPGCVKEGGCNFTTIGGLFELIGEAQYDGPGTYRRKNIP